ncbi:YidC/Oxa1 family membrane protein insertase [bacterium]|nr:YidC/Oxa1 family membrane protein insertase [bacterium]
MKELFTTIFYQPIFNLLIFLYNNFSFGDLGIAIILLTIIIRLVFLPLSKKAIKSQKSLQDIQPKIEELKKRYAGKKEEMGKAMLNLYKENKVNPFSSCLPLLIQLPFFIAVYHIFREGVSVESLNLTYSFIAKPEVINNIAFGFLDLSKPNAILAILTGLAQFWQTKMITTKKPEVKGDGTKDENMMAMMNKQMTYFLPLFIVFIGLTFPAALTLYMFVFNVSMALQQMYIFKKKKKKDGDGSDNGDKKIIDVQGEDLKQNND